MRVREFHNAKYTRISCATIRAWKLSTTTTPTPAEIKALRTRFGYSQTVFGEMLYVKLRTVQDWEYGKSPMPIGLGDLANLKAALRLQKPPST